MADAKLTALDAIAAISDEDLIYAVDDPSGTPAQKKATFSQVKTWINTTAQESSFFHGFLNRSESSIAFDDSTYTLTLTDAGSGWTYYRSGVKHTITGNKTSTITGTPPTAGEYYFYIDATDGTITNGGTAWTLLDDKVPVAAICWNDSLTPKYCLADERHDVSFTKQAHAYEHLTTGTRYESGAAISGYTVAPTTPADANNTYALSAAYIWDEDYRHTLSALSDGGTYHIEYRTGASTWEWLEQAIPFKYTTDGYIQYDNAGTMTEGSSAKYYNTYVLLTNGNANSRFAVVHGQAEHATLAAAQAVKFSDLTLTGLQFAEAVAVWKLTWYASAAYSTTGKCRLAAEPQKITTSLISTGSADPRIKSAQSLQWTYDSSATISTGLLDNEWRANNATMASATEIYISGNAPLDVLGPLTQLKKNDYVIFQDVSNSSNAIKAILSSDATDSGTIITLPIYAPTVIGTISNDAAFSVIPWYTQLYRNNAVDGSTTITSSSNQLTPVTTYAVNVCSTLAEDTEIQTPSAPAFSKTFTLKIKNTGGQTITFASGWTFAGGVAPVPTSAANGVDWYVFQYDTVLSAWVIGSAALDIKAAS